jgi:hypothetical protein
MFSVEVPLAVPVMLTWLGLREHVGRSLAVPVPANATVQVKFTVPVKPPPGTIETVVLPVPPGAEILIVVGFGERLNVGVTAAWFTLTFWLPTAMVADRELPALGATLYATEELKDSNETQLALLEATIGHDVVTEIAPLAPALGAVT